ncbi:MAG: 2-amino-4-hydroxy-6-hydroxymethyldihydropteridine diphosphokinase [Pirellulales bacterium]|nr:2-amino-4-hydroxy-6-hydroxymethyldihydropteridine diphosphokinase [Pirellulales bacterium]
MPTCLLGLGANLGDCQATLETAVREIAALPNVQVVRASRWQRTKPVGGPAGQNEFVNGALLIESSLPALTLLAELQQIETRHGRQRTERWAPRTLDIDLLLYGRNVCETAMLTLPHPRMSFRPFVLVPAVEVAPAVLHPTIGWPLERLLLHLQQARDAVALISPCDSLRAQLTATLQQRRAAYPASASSPEVAERFWPSRWTTWFDCPKAASASAREVERVANPTYVARHFPKLSVLVDADIAQRGADKLHWSTLVRQPGRGPTLRLQTTNLPEIEAELLAAIDAVWA